MKRLFYLLLLFVVPGIADAQKSWPHGRIRVTADGHYLEYADGTPFFWLGDTGWEILIKLDTASIDMYLEDRRKKGFNVIQAVILTETPNYYGDRSMVGNDPTKPVERYFQLIDRVVRMAMKKEMVMAFVPSWGDKVTAIRSKAPALFNKSNAYMYGLYLGGRYKDCPNVIWIAGGDNPAFVDTADWRPVFRAMIKGLREGSEGRELITYHPWGENSSTAYWQEPNTLDLQMMQTGHAKHDITGWDWVHRDRAYQPVRPVLDGEPNYEDHPVNWDTANGYFRDYDVRKAIYRSVFAGACGVTYGHHAVWQFYGPSDKEPFAYPDRYWKNALDRPGAYQAGYLKRLMLSIPVNRRIPDDAIISEGQGTGGEYITAFRGDDSSYAMVYMPVGKTIGLDMHWLKGVKAGVEWYDPARGRVKKHFETRVRGTMKFTPPAEGKGRDWVLIIRDRS